MEVAQPAPETSRSVPFRPRHPRTCWRRATIVMLAAVGLWAAIGLEASASSVGVGSPRPSAHAGHRCQCGMGCEGACCCAPKATHRQPPAPRTPAAPASVLGAIPGSCVTSAPCGALPTGPGPLDRRGEPADRSLGDAPAPARSLSLLAPPASDCAEARPGSRPDEPPESLADA